MNRLRLQIELSALVRAPMMATRDGSAVKNAAPTWCRAATDRRAKPRFGLERVGGPHGFGSFLAWDQYGRNARGISLVQT